jgi:hypothetical protein
MGGRFYGIQVGLVHNFVFNGLSLISRPERWANIPDAAASIPGIWANLMTFGGGPRACIGYRFSLVE